MKYTVQSAVRKNGKPFKPNEDYCIADAEHGVFIVADGVTQSIGDYAPGMTKSDAGMAAELTARALHEALTSPEEPAKALEDGVCLAIRRVAEYNQTASASYPPASCVIAACIRGDRLYYAYLGDSIAFLLRGTARIQLAEQQTRYLSAYRRLTGKKISKDDIYAQYTNNASSPGGYGVVLGDMRAMDLLRVSSIALEPGDRVIISSDGLDQYLFFAPFADVKSLSPEAMIAASAPFDEPPFGSVADDKSIITIDIME